MVNLRGVCFLLVAVTMVHCTGVSNDKPNSDEPSTLPFGLTKGDSIPLDEAIRFFDGLHNDGDFNEQKTSVELINQLDSLKQRLDLDPENKFLLEEIARIESSVELISAVEKDIEQRDSILK